MIFMIFAKVFSKIAEDFHGFHGFHCDDKIKIRRRKKENAIF